MVKLARIYWDAPRAGWMAAAIAVLVHAQLDFWHTAQPESFGGMVTIFALLAVGTRLRDPAPRSREHLRRWSSPARSSGSRGCSSLRSPAAARSSRRRSRSAVERAAPRGAKPRRPVDRASPSAARSPSCSPRSGSARRARSATSGRCSSSSRRTTPRSRWVGETVPGMLYWGFTEWLVTYSSLPTVGVLLYLVLRRRDEDYLGAIVVFAIIVVHIVGHRDAGKVFPVSLRRDVAAHRDARRARLRAGLRVRDGARRARRGGGVRRDGHRPWRSFERRRRTYLDRSGSAASCARTSSSRARATRPRSTGSRASPT